METALQILRLAAVVALVIVAGILATPPGRVPLALRGLYRLMRKDDPGLKPLSETKAPTWKKLLSFLLVILAFLLAVTC